MIRPSLVTGNPTTVLRKAVLAAHPIVVGAARETPASAKASPDEALASAAPVQPVPQVDHAAQLEAALEQARKQGYAEGLARGTEETRRALSQRRAELNRLAASVEAAKSDVLASAEGLALSIAWEAVCKVLGEASVTKQGIQALIAQAVSKARAEDDVIVRLAAADLAFLREDGIPGDALSRAGAAEGESRKVDLVADPSIELGGCIVETRAGRIDATLETQLAGLREALIAIRRPGRPAAEAR